MLLFGRFVLCHEKEQLLWAEFGTQYTAPYFAAADVRVNFFYWPGPMEGFPNRDSSTGTLTFTSVSL